jgi:hypothetical protein
MQILQVLSVSRVSAVVTKKTTVETYDKVVSQEGMFGIPKR